MSDRNSREELLRELADSRYAKQVAKQRAEKAEAALEQERANNAVLREALEWAFPLALKALEDARQLRLLNGHSDIGAGTKFVGLYPDEIEKCDAAKHALSSNPGAGVMEVVRAALNELRDLYIERAEAVGMADCVEQTMRREAIEIVDICDKALASLNGGRDAE